MERWWGKNHHLKREKVAFLFAPVIDIQMLLLKSPLFIHPLSIFYSVFSQCLLSQPPPAIFLFYSSISLFSVSFLSGPQWLPHINSQTGSQDPVSQYLSWELPGRSPSWQPLALKDMDRSSIPGRAHWFLDASNPRRYEKGPWRGLPCANFKFILDLGILVPHKIAETLVSFQCTEWNDRNVKTRNSNIRRWTVALLN